MEQVKVKYILDDDLVRLENGEVIKIVDYTRSDTVFYDSNNDNYYVTHDYTEKELNDLVKKSNTVPVKEFFENAFSVEDKLDILNSKEFNPRHITIKKLWFQEKLRLLRCNNIVPDQINKCIMYLISEDNLKPDIDDLILNVHLYIDKMFLFFKAKLENELNFIHLKTLKEHPLIFQNDRHQVYLNCMYTMETRIVNFLSKNLRNNFREIETLADIKTKIQDKKLSDEQIKAVYNAVNNKISIINGGPGTGKTTMIKTIIDINKRKNIKTIITAFTGKAVNRIIQSGCNDGAEVATMDSIICSNFIPSREENHVIIDEFSMVSMSLFFRFIVSNPNCKYTLIGDTNQLPPIGIGNMMSALLQCKKIPLVTLTRNYRSNIETDEWIDSLEFPNEDISVNDAVDLYISGKFDICICPLNKIVDEFNDKIRNRLGYTNKWDIGDKVISTVNTESVTNGLSGVISSIDASNIYVRFENDKLVKFSKTIPRRIIDTPENMDDIVLSKKKNLNISMLKYGYAITVHKSQGSEYDNVLIITGSSFWSKFYTRNLLFTAITRFKEKVFVAGPRKLLRQTIDNKISTDADTLHTRIKNI